MPLLEPKVVSDLSELEAFCGAPLEVKVMVRKQPFHFTGRRLKPSESREIKMILESAVPPVIQEEGEQRYNFRDETYLKIKETTWCRARALAIWFAFPCFKEQMEKEVKAAGAVQRLEPSADDIVKWIGGRQLEDDILEDLFAAVTQEEVKSYLGFTSGNSSLKS